MFVRLRRYRSLEQALEDLRRLGLQPRTEARGPVSALFVEGGREEISWLGRTMRERRAEGAVSLDGHHPRACLVGHEDIIVTQASSLVDRDLIEQAVHSHRSYDASPMELPRGRLTFDRPLTMGILNVTPDSFSDGVKHRTVEGSVLRALAMVEEGADIVDVGGESTRPGAEPVALEEELARTIPVVREIAARTEAPISIDTTKPEVAMKAVEAGASIINDVSGLANPRMVEVATKKDVPVVLMHMLGDPKTMQSIVTPSTYDDVISDIMWFWEERMDRAERQGLSRERVILDPGLGFGKTLKHNLEILARIREFRSLGRPILVGASRKGFVGRTAGDTHERRLGGSVAAAAWAAMNGADVVRVHDVPETVGALRLMEALGRRRG